MNTKNLLLGLLVVIVFVIGIAIGRLNLTSSDITDITRINTPSSSMNSTSNTTTRAGTTTAVSDETVDRILSAMTDDQKAALQALGIDVNRITPEMVACAEAKLGAARIQEIRNGAELSFSEKLGLVACYR